VLPLPLKRATKKVPDHKTMQARLKRPTVDQTKWPDKPPVTEVEHRSHHQVFSA